MANDRLFIGKRQCSSLDDSGCPRCRLERSANTSRREEGTANHGLAKAMNPLGAQKVGFHERFNRLARLAGTPQVCRYLNLMFVRQHVSVPPCQEMQVVSQSEQEILRIENL